MNLQLSWKNTRNSDSSTHTIYFFCEYSTYVQWDYLVTVLSYKCCRSQRRNVKVITAYIRLQVVPLLTCSLVHHNKGTLQELHIFSNAHTVHCPMTLTAESMLLALNTLSKFQSWAYNVPYTIKLAYLWCALWNFSLLHDWT